jgi:mannosyltransferase
MTAPFLHMHPIWDAGDRTTRRRVLLALLLTSWALGLLLLDAKSFWLDEANGLKVVRLGLPALWAGQTELYHPPLFHWLLQGWLAGGTREFYLRFPAVCCSTLSVLAAYRLAAAWFGRAVALTAALLMALSPLLV